MRAGYINNNEAVAGRRLQVRSAVSAAGWPSINLDDLGYSGADFMWYTDHKPHKVVGIQSKTLIDYWQSWTNGLLQDEMYRMIRSVDIPVLLLEEWPRIDHRTGVAVTNYGPLGTSHNPASWDAFAHSIADLTGNAPARFHLVPSPDMKYTIRWLTEIGPRRYDGREFEGWSRIMLPPRRKERALQFLLSWVGIGEDRARTLLRVFGTPLGVLKALHNGDALKVPGIGKATIKGVIDQLNEQYVERES